MSEPEKIIKGKEPDKVENPSFKNKISAARYIKDQGVKIGKSKLYKDAESGKLRVQADGSVFLSDVDLYIRAYGTPRQKAAGSADIELLQKEKLELESQKLRGQIARMDWEREKEAGRYLLRSDFEMELAARAAVLVTSLQQMASSKAYEWIAACKGDHNKTADLTAMITAEIGAVLNDYAATDRYQVIFVEGSSEKQANSDLVHERKE